MHNKRSGFTLIELLIVVVIIGLLATIATSFFWDAKDRALLSTMQSDLRALAAHQEEHYPIGMTYAGDVTELDAYAGSPGVVISITYGANDGWAAQATHPSYAGHTCGLFIGDAPAANAAPATIPGTVACD